MPDSGNELPVSGALTDLAGQSIASEKNPVMSPAEELSVFVTGAAGLFYAVESGVNPAVRTYWDALHYVATSLSVGYANFFPVTEWGKAIASVVQMLGPALSARALDGARSEAAPPADPAMLEKLDAILVQLKRLNHER